MNRPLRPQDLPPPWLERFHERAAIVQEGCGYLPDVDGVRRANREAFAMIVDEMGRAGEFQDGLYG